MKLALIETARNRINLKMNLKNSHGMPIIITISQDQEVTLFCQKQVKMITISEIPLKEEKQYYYQVLM